MDLNIIEELVNTIKDRKNNPKAGSYTNMLLESDNKIVKKLGEENAEYIRAFLIKDNKEVAGEAADILYHLLVSLAYRNVDFVEVLSILEERHRN